MTYLRSGPKYHRKIVKKITSFLKSKKIKFDGFVGRGISGITIASMLAYSMNKNLVIVRKSAKNNHSGNLVEGLSLSNRLIIIDDFVESGKTIKEIVNSLDNTRAKIDIEGAIFYNSLSSKRDIQSNISPKVLLRFWLPLEKK